MERMPYCMTHTSSTIDLKFDWKALNKIYPDPNFAVAEDIKSAFDAIAKVRDSE